MDCLVEVGPWVAWPTPETAHARVASLAAALGQLCAGDDGPRWPLWDNGVYAAAIRAVLPAAAQLLEARSGVPLERAVAGLLSDGALAAAFAPALLRRLPTAALRRRAAAAAVRSSAAAAPAALATVAARWAARRRCHRADLSALRDECAAARAHPLVWWRAVDALGDPLRALADRLAASPVHAHAAGASTHAYANANASAIATANQIPHPNPTANANAIANAFVNANANANVYGNAHSAHWLRPLLAAPNAPARALLRETIAHPAAAGLRLRAAVATLAAAAAALDLALDSASELPLLVERARTGVLAPELAVAAIIAGSQPNFAASSSVGGPRGSAAAAAAAAAAGIGQAADSPRAAMLDAAARISAAPDLPEASRAALTALSVLFHSDALPDAAVWVHVELGFDVPVAPGALAAWAAAWRQAVAPEPCVAASIAALAPAAADADALARACRCVLFALQSGIAARNAVDSAAWLANACARLVRPMPIELADALRALAHHAAAAGAGGTPPVPEPLLLALLRADDDDPASVRPRQPAALYLYLAYAARVAEAPGAARYSPAVAAASPLGRVLHHIGRHRGDGCYEHVYPYMMAWAAQLHPALFWDDGAAAARASDADPMDVALGVPDAALRLRVRAGASDSSAQLLGWLGAARIDATDEFRVTLNDLLRAVRAQLLSPDADAAAAPNRAEELAVRLLRAFLREYPYAALARFVAVLCDVGPAAQVLAPDVIADPCLVLRGCGAFLHRPLLLALLLAVLDLAQLEARSWVATAAPGAEAAARALLLLQDTAALQVLLDCCVEDRFRSGAGERVDEFRMQEVRALVCAHVHRVCVDRPDVLQVLHLQGYADALQEMLVHGVAAMHVCLDFLPLHLDASGYHGALVPTHVFLVKLACRLAVVYPTERAAAAARLVDGMLDAMRADGRVAAAAECAPLVRRMRAAFPLDFPPPPMGP